MSTPPGKKPEPVPGKNALMQPFAAYKKRPANGFINAYDIDPARDRDVKIGHVVYEYTEAVKTHNIPAGDRIIAELLNARNEPAFVDVETGKPLRWVVNVTNQKTITQLIGSSVPALWTGRVITLYHTTIEDRKTKAPTGAIRVRPKLPSYDRGPTAAHLAYTAKAAEEAKRSLESDLAFMSEAPPPEAKAAAALPPIDTANDASQTYIDPPPEVPS